jgi:sulfoxide reductase heme-binding subunit YedZ
MKAGKHNFEQPIVWGLVVAVLLGLRVFWSWNRTRSPAASRPVRS